MHMPSATQLLVILAIIVLIFGGKRIAEVAKGLGAGVKNFKNAVKDDDEQETKQEEIKAMENPADTTKQNKKTSKKA